MKKRLLLLLPFLALTGCDTTTGTTSTSSLTSTSTSTASDETSDSTPAVKTEKEIVEEALASARGSIVVTGTSNQVRHFTNPAYAINDTDYDSQDEIVIQEKAYHRVAKREDDTTFERKAYKDERGRACEQYLTYKNEVALTPIVDNLGNDVLFENDYGNPFDIVTYDDLTKEESGYRLSGDKAQLFVYRLTGEKVTGDVLLTLDANRIATISGTDLTGEEYFVSTQTYAKIETTFSFDYTLALEAPTIEDSLVPSTNENADLALVLEGLEDGFRFNNLMDGEVTMSTYFDGTEALFQMMAPGSTEPQYFDMYLTPNAEGTMDLYWCNMDETTYELYWEANDPSYTEMYFEKVAYAYLASDIASLSPAVFEPGTAENTYVPVEGALQHIGEGIVPGIYDALGLSSYEEFRLNMSSLVLTIVDEHTFNLDCTSVIFNGTTTARISASFQFADIGTATLPYAPVLD